MTKKNITLKKITPFIIIAGLGVAGYFIWKYFKEKPPTPPEWPKLVCRNPYCFDAYNEEEWIQLREFLGIEPVGVDIDTYLSRLSNEQMNVWRDYWITIWIVLMRDDLIDFVHEMYDKYYGEIVDIKDMIITTS